MHYFPCSPEPAVTPVLFCHARTCPAGKRSWTPTPRKLRGQSWYWADNKRRFSNPKLVCFPFQDQTVWRFSRNVGTRTNSLKTTQLKVSVNFCRLRMTWRTVYLWIHTSVSTLVFNIQIVRRSISALVCFGWICGLMILSQLLTLVLLARPFWKGVSS